MSGQNNPVGILDPEAELWIVQDHWQKIGFDKTKLISHCAWRDSWLKSVSQLPYFHIAQGKREEVAVLKWREKGRKEEGWVWSVHWNGDGEVTFSQNHILLLCIPPGIITLEERHFSLSCTAPNPFINRCKVHALSHWAMVHPLWVLPIRKYFSDVMGSCQLPYVNPFLTISEHKVWMGNVIDFCLSVCLDTFHKSSLYSWLHWPFLPPPSILLESCFDAIFPCPDIGIALQESFEHLHAKMGVHNSKKRQTLTLDSITQKPWMHKPLYDNNKTHEYKIALDLELLSRLEPGEYK